MLLANHDKRTQIDLAAWSTMIARSRYSSTHCKNYIISIDNMGKLRHIRVKCTENRGLLVAILR